MRVDLEEECDPPSFTAGQKKLKILQVGIAWLTVYVILLNHHVTLISLVSSYIPQLFFKNRKSVGLFQLEQELAKKLDDYQG